MRDFWEVGEDAAHKRLAAWEADVDDYDDKRNLPSVDKVSRLSPHLHFGEISPIQIWHRFKDKRSKGWETFEGELIWRDYSQNAILQFPKYATQNYREDFDRFPWRDPANDPAAARDLKAWQQGRTGYPIVDAGMRELWATGWMHNRVRMIVASFLVKHLRLSWTHGAAWFWDTLVDADLASNTLGWQWSAGCGADAAPYFRVFAPVLQGVKFDASGAYVRQWVPELARMPAEHIHAPWEAPLHVLAEADVQLGGNYPAPIVDHAKARAEALAAFKALRGE
eukprot:gene50770-62091_t